MKRFASFAILTALMLPACGEDKPAAPAGGAPSAATPAAPAPSADFGTPTAVAQAWAKACAAKDKDAIALCINPETKDGDLKEIRSKTGSDRNYGQLAEMFGAATVAGEKINDAGDAAVVEVNSKRPEKIKMVKKDGRWWIDDM